MSTKITLQPGKRIWRNGVPCPCPNPGSQDHTPGGSPIRPSLPDTAKMGSAFCFPPSCHRNPLLLPPSAQFPHPGLPWIAPSPNLHLQYSSRGDLTWVPSKPTPLTLFSHLRTLSRYHCTSPFRSCSPLNSTMLVIVFL